VKLNLGAGSRVLDGYVNVDQAQLPGIDLAFDLDMPVPWPWADASVTMIEAKDIFEHVRDPVHFMVQCHRILRPNGTLHIRTPHMSSPDSWTDPTHVRHCNEHSFDFWIPGNVHYETNNAGYGGVSFGLAGMEMDRGTIDVTLRKTPGVLRAGRLAPGDAAGRPRARARVGRLHDLRPRVVEAGAAVGARPARGPGRADGLREVDAAARDTPAPLVHDDVRDEDQ
jgi:SAM-dependent methyltransferase